MLQDRYCLLFDIPHTMYGKADVALASFIGTSLLWVPHVNAILSMIGLGLGIFIGCVRAWKAWKYRNQKDN